MAISRRCPNCQQLYQGKLCKKCANKKSKERQKNNEALKLYGSATWKKCRRNVLIRYHEIDIWMLGIGIVGQYLAKTYLETKNRPIYLVRKTNIEK